MTQTEPTAPPATRDEQDSLYYFKDIYFLVEKTLFKVPRHHFEQESAIFRDVFSLPVGSEGTADGSSRETPLHLDGINKDDFRQLLRVLYPTHFGRVDLSVFQWSSVLKLATMWEFKNIRNIAIGNLTSMAMDGVTRIALAKEYSIWEWWYPALCAIAKQTKRITEEDVDRLGVALGLRVAEFQGRVFGCSNGVNAHTTGSKDEWIAKQLQSIIGTLFPECPNIPVVETPRCCRNCGIDFGTNYYRYCPNCGCNADIC